MLGKNLMDYSIVVRKVIELWMKENGNNTINDLIKLPVFEIGRAHV